MTNNKQSSVDAIIQFMKENQYFIGNDLYQFFEQAKAMHKEEIVDAHNRGIWAEPKPFDDGEHYYNETFGGNNGQQ